MIGWHLGMTLSGYKGTEFYDQLLPFNKDHELERKYYGIMP